MPAFPATMGLSLKGSGNQRSFLTNTFEFRPLAS